jgi:hypothetical protein
MDPVSRYAPDETVYVSSAFYDNVFKITKAGAITRILTPTGDGLHAVSTPQGVAVDGQNNVYAVSTDNGVVFKVTSGGAISARITGLDTPFQIATFRDTLYVSEGNRVTKRAPDGTLTQPIDSSGDGQGHTRTPTSASSSTAAEIST